MIINLWLIIGTMAGIEGKNFWNGRDYSINPIGNTSSVSKDEYKVALKKAELYNNSEAANTDTEILKARLKDCWGVTEENTNIKIDSKASPKVGISEDNLYVGKYNGKFYKMGGYTIGNELHGSPYVVSADEVVFDAIIGHEYMHIQQYNNFGQTGIDEVSAYQYSYNTYKVAGYSQQMLRIQEIMMFLNIW